MPGNSVSFIKRIVRAVALIQRSIGGTSVLPDAHGVNHGEHSVLQAVQQQDRAAGFGQRVNRGDVVKTGTNNAFKVPVNQLTHRPIRNAALGQPALHQQLGVCKA